MDRDTSGLAAQGRDVQVTGASDTAKTAAAPTVEKRRAAGATQPTAETSHAAGTTAATVAETNRTAPAAATPVIETSHLAKSYGHARGIVDVTMRVEPGEVFGFIGPNGAGKSTTIRTLLGLIHKDSGEARIFGHDCQAERVAIAREVGYLPSEVRYYDRMRGRDLVAYAASFYANPAACRTRGRELAERLDLDLDKRIDDMSLGNRKKVGIVQALLHSPRLIVLDEPTSGLDPLVQRTFFGLLREENERGATILFSSHVLSEVQRACDRVAIIREGRIVRTQDVAELAASAVKRVSVEFAAGAAADAGTLEHLGAQAVETDGPHASFLFSGGANALMHALASLDLANVDVSEPSLEEVFLRYYGDDATTDASAGTAGAGKSEGATGPEGAGKSEGATGPEDASRPAGAHAKATVPSDAAPNSHPSAPHGEA